MTPEYAAPAHHATVTEVCSIDGHDEFVPNASHQPHPAQTLVRPPQLRDLAASLAGSRRGSWASPSPSSSPGFVLGLALYLVIAIGDLVMEAETAGCQELIVELFGSNDKLTLDIGVVLASLLVAGL